MRGRHWRRILAEGISRFVNPLVVVAAVFILVVTGFEVARPGATLAVCLAFGVFLPLAYVRFLMFRGEVDGFFIPLRAGRLRPLLVVSASCLTGVVLLQRVAAPPEVWALMLCYAVNAVLMAVFTLRWKVSLHAGGAWGSLVAVVFLFGSFALFLVPVPLAVSWARVELGAHTPAQVLGGGGLGLAATWLQFALVLDTLPF